MSTAPTGRLPDFVIIGATKAGTTSLHLYLSLHPELFLPALKEPNFFDGSPRGNWHRGEDWYRGLFVTRKRLCGEASGGYTHWPAMPMVAERMSALMPGCRLLYCLREPLDRLRSHFLMSVRRGFVSGSFAEFLASPVSEFARCASRYGTQLQNFLRFYPRAQILVLESARLKHQREAVLAEVFGFLGVDPSFHSRLFRHERHVGGQQPFPGPLARRLMKSPTLAAIERRMSPQLFYHFRNLLLRPLAAPAPSLELLPAALGPLREELRREVALVRALSGLALPSLGL